MYRGWIKLWRKIEDHRFWKEKPISKLHAWIDLLKRASYKDQILMNGANKTSLKRGQILTSQDKLARDWGWSRGKVRRFLNQMCSGDEPEMIQQTDTKSTILTILNYETYQGDEPANGQVNGHKTDTKRTQNGHIEELKNKRIKKEKTLMSEKKFSDADFSLAEYLKEKILTNSPEEIITDSQLKNWADICRLMRERDKRTYDGIKGLIQFVHGDEKEGFPRNEFWFMNIRSMGKLRKHFGRLWDEMIKAGYTIESEVKDGA